jgi:hypothetical protein
MLSSVYRKHVRRLAKQSDAFIVTIARPIEPVRHEFGGTTRH